ncbi:hypothetical protein BHM03_00059588 [Ensete ventricosum]|nr:hypothetical protein BHM03_00059588 [Ensete ventricosum]
MKLRGVPPVRRRFSSLTADLRCPQPAPPLKPRPSVLPPSRVVDPSPDSQPRQHHPPGHSLPPVSISLQIKRTFPYSPRRPLFSTAIYRCRSTPSATHRSLLRSLIIVFRGADPPPPPSPLFHRRSRPLRQRPLPTATSSVNAAVSRSPSCSRRTILTPVAASAAAGTPTASRSSTLVSTPSQLLASSVARADLEKQSRFLHVKSNDADFRRWLLHLLLIQPCPFHLKRMATGAHAINTSRFPPVVTASCCLSSRSVQVIA